MKSLIILTILISSIANASYHKPTPPPVAPAPSAAPAAHRAQRRHKSNKLLTAPTPQETALVTFPDTLASNIKVYLATYNSRENKEEIRVNLDCSAETNLKSVKSSYGYSLFKKYAKTICHGINLPFETK